MGVLQGAEGEEDLAYLGLARDDSMEPGSSPCIIP